jgi:hypothetical protein
MGRRDCLAVVVVHEFVVRRFGLPVDCRTEKDKMGPTRRGIPTSGPADGAVGGCALTLDPGE